MKLSLVALSGLLCLGAFANDMGNLEKVSKKKAKVILNEVLKNVSTKKEVVCYDSIRLTAHQSSPKIARAELDKLINIKRSKMYVDRSNELKTNILITKKHPLGSQDIEIDLSEDHTEVLSYRVMVISQPTGQINSGTIIDPVYKLPEGSNMKKLKDVTCELK